jgi:uncharacterized caspase-like protein
MVGNANELVGQLKLMGFPPEHLIFLPNELATSQRIDVELRKFWKGGELDKADRLLFYFGGHGEALPSAYFTDTGMQKRGVLVTYDFDPSSPALSGLLLDDLLSRHARYMATKHVLFLLDACSSGLLLPQYQNQDETAEVSSHFRKLAVLRANTKEPARDFLVAGTGDEKALWINGGIFTRAVIEGLKGKAALTHDGLIEFDELAFQVKHDVAAKAAETDVPQAPAKFSTGDGQFVFIEP